MIDANLSIFLAGKVIIISLFWFFWTLQFATTTEQAALRFSPNSFHK
jgi:hypothetical protein